MIERAKLTYDELATAVTKVETVINLRPLSYISSDNMNHSLPLTFWLDADCSVSDCQITDDDFDVSPERLTKRMQFLNKVVNNFFE